MRKLILVAMFMMVAGVAAARGVEHGSCAEGVASAGPGGESDVGAAVGGVESEDAPVPLNDWCYDFYAACTADCMDFVGSAKGACLRACRFELEECLGN